MSIARIQAESEAHYDVLIQGAGIGGLEAVKKFDNVADHRNIGSGSGAILIISMKARVDARIDDAGAIQRFSRGILGLRRPERGLVVSSRQQRLRR
jgi:hypothetical protein